MEKYKVAIIGAGNISSEYDNLSCPYILTHAHAVLQSSEFELVGFYDINRDKAKSAAEKWGCLVLKSMEDVKNMSDIICIAVPDEFHYNVLKQCVNFSSLKAVIAEKPIARTVKQAEEIIELYHNIPMPVFVNYSRRYVEAFNRLKKWIANKAGKLIMGNCYYGKGISHNGSHLINLMDFFFEKILIEKTGNRIADYFEDDPSVDFQLLIDNAVIYFHSIPCNIVTIFDFELYFEKGKVYYCGEKETIDYYDIGMSEIYSGERNYIFRYSDKIDSGKALVGLYENIVDVLEHGGEIKCDIYDAVQTLRLCEKIKNIG